MAILLLHKVWFNIFFNGNSYFACVFPAYLQVLLRKYSPNVLKKFAKKVYEEVIIRTEKGYEGI